MGHGGRRGAHAHFHSLIYLNKIERNKGLSYLLHGLTRPSHQARVFSDGAVISWKFNVVELTVLALLIWVPTWGSTLLLMPVGPWGLLDPMIWLQTNPHTRNKMAL